MKQTKRHSLQTVSQHPPTVEVAVAASALYIRFNRGKVARTVRHESKWPLVTVDLDADGEVLGVEGVGVTEFGLLDLLKRANIQSNAETVALARFHFGAKPQPAAA